MYKKIFKIWKNKRVSIVTFFNGTNYYLKGFNMSDFVKVYYVYVIFRRCIFVEYTRECLENMSRLVYVNAVVYIQTHLTDTFYITGTDKLYMYAEALAYIRHIS